MEDIMRKVEALVVLEEDTVSIDTTQTQSTALDREEYMDPFTVIPSVMEVLHSCLHHHCRCYHHHNCFFIIILHRYSISDGGGSSSSSLS